MADNQNVVDELIVKLTLDSKEYDKADKEIDKHVTQTEKKAKDTDSKRKKREQDGIKRSRETLKSVKELALGLRNLAFTVGSMLGIGSAAGIVGAVVALAGMETNLRRAAVGTAMSNREMQAWGATARRLGADADAGAQAIADLAREQKTFNLTGSGPTMQAFARMGVNLGPDTNIADALAQAQQLYRGANPAQKQQYESGLTAMGVSPDLILMIKSEKDAREQFTKSYAESATENRKAIDAVTDALAALGNSATNLANSIATVAQPYIEQFAHWVGEGATQMSAFVDKVMAAGGGVDGFMKVLNEQAPQLAALLRDVGTSLTVMGQAVDVITYGFQSLYRGVNQLFVWIDEKLGALTGGNGHALRDAVGTVGDAIKWGWGNLVGEARREGAAPVGSLTGSAGGVALSKGAAARVAAGGGATDLSLSPGESVVSAPRSAPGESVVSAPRRGAATAQDMMHYLVAQHGFSVAQAAAVVANSQGESSLNPAAVSPDGGALGLQQWRGPRIAAFRKQFGVNPNQATWQQQLDFLATNQYERGLLNKSFAAAGPLGQNVSRIFEAHGNVAEDVRRGQAAQQLASQYDGGETNSQTISIQTVNVQANTPQEFTTQLQRVSGVQNYTAAVR